MILLNLSNSLLFQLCPCGAIGSATAFQAVGCSLYITI
ncbi:hypothetical protein pb186bvf_012668 [Paramecium bursaria]